MTKMYKLTVYVIDINNEGIGMSEIMGELEGSNDHVFINAIPEGTVNIGKWDDDHPLNDATSDSFEEYFQKGRKKKK